MWNAGEYDLFVTEMFISSASVVQKNIYYIFKVNKVNAICLVLPRRRGESRLVLNQIKKVYYLYFLKPLIANITQ